MIALSPPPCRTVRPVIEYVAQAIDAPQEAYSCGEARPNFLCQCGVSAQNSSPAPQLDLLVTAPCAARPLGPLLDGGGRMGVVGAAVVLTRSSPGSICPMFYGNMPRELRS